LLLLRSQRRSCLRRRSCCLRLGDSLCSCCFSSELFSFSLRASQRFLCSGARLLRLRVDPLLPSTLKTRLSPTFGLFPARANVCTLHNLPRLQLSARCVCIKMPVVCAQPPAVQWSTDGALTAATRCVRSNHSTT
jgi:hypothetical protein